MRKGEATRQAVLDEAANVASLVGLGGLTIGTLAEQTQMSKSGLFAHFKSKEALQVAVLERAAQRYTDAVIAPALKAPRGEPRLRELFEREMRWVQTPVWPGGCIITNAMAELDDQPGPARDRLVQAKRDWLDVITQVTSGGIREGHFREDVDAEGVAFQLHGISLAYFTHHRLLHDPDAADRARRAFEALLNGIRQK